MTDSNYFEQYKYCALEADRAYAEIKHIENIQRAIKRYCSRSARSI